MSVNSKANTKIKIDLYIKLFIYINNLMFNIILATDINGGIGLNNDIPWNFSKDMEFFRNITKSNNIFDKAIVIMGRKTIESLPKQYLPNRINIVISSTLEIKFNNKYSCVRSFHDALEMAYQINGSQYTNNIWVIGGAQVYEQAFRHPDINLIYHTNIDHDFACDTSVELPKMTPCKTVRVTDVNKKNDNACSLYFCINKPILNAEQQYIKLLQDVLINGEKRMTRNGYTNSVFGRELSFDVSDSFPLLTTKRMFWKGIVEELLFFIRGDTNTSNLSQNGVKIWNGNTTREFLDNLGPPCNDYQIGDMGPMYGYQWRFFNKPYNTATNITGIDQLTNLITEIKNNPSSRRILMTDYNPSQVMEGVLYPCHSLILQFYVNESYLSVKMYQRSADSFLGLPFNIASTTLLLYIIASLTNLKPDKVSISLGDCHIYKEHYEAVIKQLSRLPYKLPKLEIPKFSTIKQVENSVYGDYKIIDYECHPGIKAPMIA